MRIKRRWWILGGCTVMVLVGVLGYVWLNPPWLQITVRGSYIVDPGVGAVYRVIVEQKGWDMTPFTSDVRVHAELLDQSGQIHQTWDERTDTAGTVADGLRLNPSLAPGPYLLSVSASRNAIISGEQTILFFVQERGRVSFWPGHREINPEVVPRVSVLQRRAVTGEPVGIAADGRILGARYVSTFAEQQVAPDSVVGPVALYELPAERLNGQSSRHRSLYAPSDRWEDVRGVVFTDSDRRVHRSLERVKLSSYTETPDMPDWLSLYTSDHHGEPVPSTIRIGEQSWHTGPDGLAVVDVTSTPGELIDTEVSPDEGTAVIQGDSEHFDLQNHPRRGLRARVERFEYAPGDTLELAVHNRHFERAGYRVSLLDLAMDGQIIETLTLPTQWEHTTHEITIPDNIQGVLELQLYSPSTTTYADSTEAISLLVRRPVALELTADWSDLGRDVQLQLTDTTTGSPVRGVAILRMLPHLPDASRYDGKIWCVDDPLDAGWCEDDENTERLRHWLLTHARATRPDAGADGFPGLRSSFGWNSRSTPPLPDELLRYRPDAYPLQHVSADPGDARRHQARAARAGIGWGMLAMVLLGMCIIGIAVSWRLLNDWWWRDYEPDAAIRKWRPGRRLRALVYVWALGLTVEWWLLGAVFHFEVYSSFVIYFVAILHAIFAGSVYLLFSPGERLYRPWQRLFRTIRVSLLVMVVFHGILIALSSYMEFFELRNLILAMLIGDTLLRVPMLWLLYRTVRRETATAIARRRRLRRRAGLILIVLCILGAVVAVRRQSPVRPSAQHIELPVSRHPSVHPALAPMPVDDTVWLGAATVTDGVATFNLPADMGDAWAYELRVVTPDGRVQVWRRARGE